LFSSPVECMTAGLENSNYEFGVPTFAFPSLLRRQGVLLMKPFVGRSQELKELHWFAKKKTASLIVLRGRRRIGKSRLIEEFAKPYRFLSFIGLPPGPRTTKESELDEFSRQFSERLREAPVKFQDWGQAFHYLGKRIAKGRVVLLLDEISWMGAHDPTFLGKLKTAWDTEFKQNNQLIVVLCGSASTWIEKNILSSTGFLGRVSRTMTLGELPLVDCAQFWRNAGATVSSYEKAKLLAVTGGVPRYLEEIDPAQSSEENIRRLCFTSGGLLVSEFAQIFNDLFLHNSPLYRKLVRALASGSKDHQAIASALAIRQTGRISSYLDELSTAGFLQRDYTWDLKTGLDKPKQSQFRLSDNYLRFYLKYMERKLTQIERGSFRFKSLESLPEWSIMMGLQFENLVLNSRPVLREALNLDLNSVVNENPFFQKPNKDQRGCQIDFLIQTKFQTLYVCEIRFSAKPIGTSVIKDVAEKISRLKRPKSFSCRPVLIHISGVTDEVVHSDYFAEIIDAGVWMQGAPVRP
jgi:uncharacterized protein